MSTVFTGHGVTMFQLLAIRCRFALEMKGLKGRGPTMYSYVKKQFGLKGSREKVFGQFCLIIEQAATQLKPGDIVSTD